MALERTSFPIGTHGGDLDKVSEIRDTRTPEARRSRAPHLLRHVVENDAHRPRIAPAPREQGAHTCTMISSVREADVVVDPLCTINWPDDRAEVVMTTIVADVGLPTGYLEKFIAQIPK